MWFGADFDQQIFDLYPPPHFSFPLRLTNQTQSYKPRGFIRWGVSVFIALTSSSSEGMACILQWPCLPRRSHQFPTDWHNPGGSPCLSDQKRDHLGRCVADQLEDRTGFCEPPMTFLFAFWCLAVLIFFMFSPILLSPWLGQLIRPQPTARRPEPRRGCETPACGHTPGRRTSRP